MAPSQRQINRLNAGARKVGVRVEAIGLSGPAVLLRGSTILISNLITSALGLVPTPSAAGVAT